MQRAATARRGIVLQSTSNETHVQCDVCHKIFKGLGIYGKHTCVLPHESRTSKEEELEAHAANLRDRVCEVNMWQHLQVKCYKVSSIFTPPFALWDLLQLVSKVQSVFLDAVTDLRYEKYATNVSVQRTKQLLHEVNAVQKEAIESILNMHGADASLNELIVPVMDATTTLLSKSSEDTAREHQYAYGVKPARRELGKVACTVKVHGATLHCCNVCCSSMTTSLCVRTVPTGR